jgi:hypothetical protein
MTVSTAKNKEAFAVYSGAAAYNWTGFVINADADVEVYAVFPSDAGDAVATAGEGSRLQLTLTTDFTVASNTPSNGGAVTINSTGNTAVIGHADWVSNATTRIAIYRSVDAITQLNEYNNQGAFLSNTIEASFDGIYFILQQHEERLGRTIQLDPWDTVLDGFTEANQRAAVRLNDLSTGLDGVVVWDGTTFNISASVSSTDLATVAGISTAVSTVAGISADVTTVAGIAANVTTVAGVSADVTTVAGVSADVTTVAADISGADTIGSAAVLVDAGNPGIPFIASAGSASLVTFGTGLALDGAGELTIDAELTDISGLTPTDGLFIVGDGNDFIGESGDTALISLGGTTIGISALKVADGTAGQYLKTDGAGAASFATPAGGGDTLAAVNEVVSGDWAFTGAPDLSAATFSKASRNALSVYDTSVDDYAALKALTAADYTVVLVANALRGGLFAWRTGDQSAEITADPGEGVWVPPTSDATGASGAWQRFYSSKVAPEWFGAVADNSTDDSTALTRSIAFAAANGVYVDLGGLGKIYKTGSAVSIVSNSDVRGFAAIHSDHTGQAFTFPTAGAACDVVNLQDFEVYSTKATVSITGATAANPVVVTLTAGHGLANGDRLRVPVLTAGMTELGGRSFELNNKSGDTFELREEVLGSGLTNLDGSGYTAWSGTVSCISFAAARTGHRAIFGQSALFNNGVGAAFYTDIVLHNLHLHGFGAEVVRLDFVRGFKVRGCKIYDAGSHGVLSLSPEQYDITHNEIYDIGPGDAEGNAGYGVSVSRVKTYTDATLGAGTEASLADSPRPTNGLIGFNRIYRIEEYVAIDSHSCDGLTVTGNVTEDCLIGYNYEHHSSAGVLAPSENVAVTGNVFRGNSGAYNSAGPGICIDTRSGGGEVAQGTTVTGNVVELHGYNGNNPAFASAGAIYARDTEGLVISGNAFNSNYGRDICLNTGNASFTVMGNASTGLQTGDAVRNSIDIFGATSDGTVSGNRYKNASGNAYNDDGSGTIDLLEFNGNRVITSARVGNFTQLNSDNLRLDGNTLSSTDANGNVLVVPNGSGSTRVTGLMSVGSGGAPGYQLDITDGSDTAMRIRATTDSASADTFFRHLVQNGSASNYQYFGDGADQDAGIMQYRHSDDKFLWTAGATQLLEMSSAGLNLLTGKTLSVGGTQVIAAQQTTTGTTTGFTAGAGTAVLDDSTFTGGSGTKAYTIGDIVLALKTHGLMAAS